MHARSRSRVVPFAWRHLQSEATTKAGGTVFDEASEDDIVDGFSVPVHTLGSLVLLSMVPDGSPSERSSALRLGREALTTLAIYVHEKAPTLSEAQIQATTAASPKLTAKERGIIQKLAAGKISVGVSMRLAVVEDAVNIHIQSIMKKLNAQSRTHRVTMPSCGELPSPHDDEQPRRYLFSPRTAPRDVATAAFPSCGSGQR